MDRKKNASRTFAIASFADALHYELRTTILKARIVP